MDLLKIAVNRPVAILMVFTAILLIGMISLTRLPVDLMPDIGRKKVTIITRVRGGMPPTEVEELVTRPIEDAVSIVSRIEEITSKSEKGESVVSIKFEAGTDMDFAVLEVREKFARIKNKLPREIERPVIARYEEEDPFVIIAAVTSGKYSTEYLRSVIDEDIKEYLLRVEGVANVDVYGGRERKILIEFNQDKLNAAGLPILYVIDKLSISNLNLLAGKVKGKRSNYMLRTIGEFESLEEIKNIAVAKTPSGSLIKLGDIAAIEDSHIEAENYARLGVIPARVPRDTVSLYIHKESQANTIKVVKGVKEQIDGPVREKLAELGLVLGKDLEIEIIRDQAKFIIQAIDAVKQSLLYGAALAVFALLYFLRNRRSAFIIFVSIPTSVVATFALMYFRNLIAPQKLISINVMTLSGLALGIGMLVDNSIVVLENIFAKRERNLETKDAVVSGTREVFLAIAASTITTIVVFLPIIFVTEEIKMLYGALAITVTFALLTSLLVAMTLVPSLSARLLGRSMKAGIKLSRLKKIYRGWLCFVLRRRYFFALGIFIALVVSIFILRTIDREFLGQTEQGKFTIFARLEAGAKLDASNEMVEEIEEILSGYPSIENFSSRVEGWSSRIYVDLLPFTKSRQSTEDVIDYLRPRLKDIERRYRGGFIYFSEIQAPGLPEVHLDVYGNNYDRLNKLIEGIGQNMASVPGMVDLKRSIEPGRPEYRVIINKEKAAYYGFTTREIADIIHAEMRGLRATVFHTESKEIETVARLGKEHRKTFEDIRNLVIATPRGDSIHLKQLADFKTAFGPSEIHRKNKHRFIELSGTSTELSLTKAVGMIGAALKDFKLPIDYYWEFGGDYKKQTEGQRQLIFALLLALILVYMILASLFESYYQPAIIMVSIPLALIGAIFTVWITKHAIGIGVIIGVIMLAGIVVNNAIILVDRINRIRKENISLTRSIMAAGRDRLRPILLTTSTTILALVPMAIDRSEASNLWSPLAITVIGGLLFSTIFTLILVPSIYIIFEDAKGILNREGIDRLHKVA